jgi:DNA-binding ferritin-like protein
MSADMDDKERLRIVLKHLIEHNEGHIEDYKRWVELAKNAGLDNVAELIEQANSHVEKAGAALKTAAGLVK